MGKFVEGSYGDQKEVYRVVDVLVMKGYEKKDITLVTSSKIKETLTTDIETKTIEEIDDEHLLNKYKDDLQKGSILIVVKERSDIDNELSSGDTNDNANSPAEDPVPNPGIDSTATTDNNLDNETPGNVPVGEDDDSSHNIPRNDNHDLTDGL